MSDLSRVLIVDDEPGVRESLQAYLEDSEEFSIQTAASAPQALELIQKETPDLIVSDIMMPQVDGYAFLKELRDDIRYARIPVIFLTARGMTSDRIEGYNAGADAYLSKPFDPEELEAMIRNLLARRETLGSGTDSAKLEEVIQEIKALKEQLNQQESKLQVTPSPIAVDLTPREQSVLDLVAEGLMNKEIARQLETSVRNVEKYVSRLFSKTGTNSRTELVRFALKHGLTD
ncbi:MAG: response regulator transcription factor [Cyanobacteria bacterium P01_H01_bin.15]